MDDFNLLQVNAKLGREGTPGEGEAFSSKQINPTRELLLSPLLNVILPCPPQHSVEENLDGLSFSLWLGLLPSDCSDDAARAAHHWLTPSTSLREAGAGGRPAFPSFKFRIFCEAGKACLRLPACHARETFTLASSGKLPVASSTPLSQGWRLFCLFVSLDIEKCIMWKSEKWKYVQGMVTGAVVNAVAFHTTRGKIRLNNSSINNVCVCQSTTSNQKQLHVAESSPVLCGYCLGMSDKSPLSQTELKKASIVSACVTMMFPILWFLVWKATMQQSLLESLSWCLTQLCPEHVVPLQIIIRFESDTYLKWAKWLTVHNPGLQ